MVKYSYFSSKITIILVVVSVFIALLINEICFTYNSLPDKNIAAIVK